MPVPPHASGPATPDRPPVPPAALTPFATADPVGSAFVPARHKAPLRPPGRRSWLVVGLLVALTALPTAVVVLAGRAALRTQDPREPYRADGGPSVIVEPGGGRLPGRDGAARVPEATAPPSGPVRRPAESADAPGAPDGPRGRPESTWCPTPGVGPAESGAAGGQPDAEPGGGGPGTGGPGTGAPPPGPSSPPGGGSGGSGSPTADPDPPAAPQPSGSRSQPPGGGFVSRVFDELRISGR